MQVRAHVHTHTHTHTLSLSLSLSLFLALGTPHRTEQKKVCPLDVYKGHGHSAVEAQMPEKPGWNKG